MWQAALPLFHVGGFQAVVRSLLNGSPFILYRRFDAQRVLQDAARMHATHVPVVDKMLQDMLDPRSGRATPPSRRGRCDLPVHPAGRRRPTPRRSSAS